MRHSALRERLIVSLDLGNPREALRLVSELARTVGMFKVGKSLFLSSGPEFVREVRRCGGDVFLDLRFHDTPQTVCRAAVEATRLGARMFDLHPYGSFEVMERARAEVTRLCRKEGLRRPQMLAVTMLAGLSRVETQHVPSTTPNRIAQLAKLAIDAALDGVFTSLHQTASVRAACGRPFIVVTSGLQAENGCDAEARSVGAAEAVRAGADYLVVSSPVWRAAEPRRAVREIVEEMDRGLRLGQRAALEIFPTRPV
jgi:orotidine-5'-phosphate decarboxylase